MTKYSPLLLLLLLEILFIVHYLPCKQLNDSFHYSSFDVSLKTIDAIHSDGHTSVNITRFIHNKLTIGIQQAFIEYISFFDTTLIAQVISPLGLMSLIAGIYYLIRKKQTVFLLLGLLLLLLPFVEIFMNTKVSFSLFAFSDLIIMVIISLYGLVGLINIQRFRFILCFMCAGVCLSLLWYFNLPVSLQAICFIK